MEKACIIDILRDIISDYLNSDIDKDEMQCRLLRKIAITEALEYDDKLLADSYCAIYHMDEEFCEVPNEEFEYYRDCLQGKHVFSRVERDKIIKDVCKN